MEPLTHPGTKPLKHSGLGIASFIISILAGMILFVCVIIAGAMEASTPGGIDEESAGAMIVGLVMFFCFFLEMLAIGIGIGGFFQKDRNKIFAILGIAFSIATCLGIIGLMILGSM